MRKRFAQSQGGFAMIENMISVVLLSIGALGIAVSTATTIKVNVDNQQRAMALNAAGTALENLYVAAQADAGATLKTSLAAYVASDDEDNPSSGFTVNANPDETGGDRDVYIVRVTKAVDGVGTNVLTGTAPFESPITVGVQVDYQGVAGKNVTGVEEIKTAKTSFTFVLGTS